MILIFSLFLVSFTNVFSANFTVSTATFTDSQGQIAKYRIGVPDTYIAGEEARVLIYLHGNNSGTQDELLDMWYSRNQREADERNLIPITVASPGTRLDGTTRQWSEDKDPQMLDELIQSGFGGRINVQQDGVYLWGDSQGTCFINSFLLAKADVYGGGALGNCGCFNYLNNSYTPGEDFRDNYRLYILGTTGDFLYNPSVNGYRFYRWTAGLKNIRGDLSRPGDHCTAPSSAVDSALSWIIGDIDIDETPDEVHWQRISTLDSIQSLDIDSRNRIIASVSSSNGNKVMISETQGDTWSTPIDLGIEDIQSAWGGDDGDILVLTESKFYRYDREGREQDRENVSFNAFREDGDGNIFRIGTSELEVSIDGGKNWRETGLGAADLPAKSQGFVDSTLSEVMVKTAFSDWSLTGKDGADNTISKPAGNIYFYSIIQHNNITLALGADNDNGGAAIAWTSNDQGQNWTPVTMHPNHTLAYSNYGLTLYHDGQLLFYDFNTAYLSADNGVNWNKEPNLSIGSKVLMTLDNEQIAYVSDGLGIFRRQAWLNSDERPEHTFGDGYTTSLNTLSKGASDLSYQRYGQALIISNHVETQVQLIRVDGSSSTLYQDNPQGKAIISIQELPRGSMIIIEDILGHRKIVKE